MRLRWGLAVMVACCLAASVEAQHSQVQSVRVVGGDDVARVIVKGQFDTPRYSVSAKEHGRLIHINIEGVSLPAQGVVTEGGHALVARTVASTTIRGVRLELLLTKKTTYHARAEDGAITIKLRAGDKPASAKRAKAGRATIESVSFERHERRQRVIVELDRPAPFRVSTRPGAPPRLEVLGAKLGAALSREINAPRDSVVERVTVEQRGDRAAVQAFGRTGVSGTAIRSGHKIIWLFTEAKEEGARPKSRSVARERDIAAEIDGPEVAGFMSDLPMQISGRRRYSGRRIDLDFKEANIHNILRLLSEVGNVNVVTADDVSGSVTIRMRNVPWDQALDVILKAKGLGMVRRGNLIRVAPAKVLELEREAEIAKQKQQIQLAPLETRLVPVSYATASELAPQVQELLSDRGKVSVDTRTNMLVVRDVVDSLGGVEALVRNLDTQTPQVLIEARIVEASSQYARDVGIQWGGDVTMSSTNGNPTGLVFPSNVTIAGGATDPGTPTAGLSPFSNTFDTPNFAVNLPAAVGNGAGGSLGLTLGSLGGNVNLNVRLSAAETTGSVRIISSPRILTLDNHQASISQGTLIPYSQVSAQGVNTAFQEAQLQLSVTPHVTSDGSVSLAVQISRNEPDFGRTSAQGAPTILKREAQTELLIRDGNTAVIGGIYTRNTGRNLDQVPVLGDIPVLGVLFRRKRFREDRNELLIFLTPRIVNRDQALPQ